MNKLQSDEDSALRAEVQRSARDSAGHTEALEATVLAQWQTQHLALPAPQWRQVLAGTGKQREAIGAFDRSLAAGFDTATAYDRAAALESLGDRAAARQAFEDIESRSPGFKDVASRIASLKK